MEAPNGAQTREPDESILRRVSMQTRREPQTPEETQRCLEQTPRREARAPLSTYRMQLHAGFKFSDAEAVLPYLKSLGIGDLYTSPIFEARPGSMHGYDVTRHDRLNPELGGRGGICAN